MSDQLQLRRLFVGDVTEVNDLLVLGAGAVPPGIRVAAMGWLLRGRPVAEGRRAGLVEAMDCVARALPTHQWWLLGAHTAWQDDRVMTRRLGLWKSLERRRIALPAGDRVGERLLESPAGIRWTGAIRFLPDGAHAAIGVIEEEPASRIVCLPPAPEDLLIRLLAGDGPGSDEDPGARLLGAVLPPGGLVARLLGAFDDPESGVGLLGEPAIIDRLR